MLPEQAAQETIDGMLGAAGWTVQSRERTASWSEGTPGGRWRAYSYEAITARDKASLDIFWLRDETLDDSDTLPAPDVLAAEIVEDLRAVLAQFQEIADDLGVEVGEEMVLS